METTFKDELAATIRILRLEQNLTQEELAGRAGIAYRYMQEIEAAEKQPSVTTLFKLATALNTDYTALLNASWEKWRSGAADDI